MAKQGKCEQCKVRWSWGHDVTIKRVSCPLCRTMLRPTSKLLKLPVRLAVWLGTQLVTLDRAAALSAPASSEASRGC